ncbi:DNA repair protein RAD50 [Cyphellophora attinorum]|uniref:DNA repair protein RAD50 n=1 Tax=Cyphellophora attinorum TaxID=1664694 RepID=A0A0N1H285_9EURO|nr:DNA repair protein RAD50 [Phialophora attinorum]KPI38706.1 DNA repair protein RAD50 [Phialophora attinorum]
MSTIDRLAIQGIRSFDSEGHYETIRFYAPLTLVVGVNGSGKTTVIEALKYAVTGILPPGAKVGGAFIHDPKLNGSTKSFGQIRLAFHSTKGIPLVVTRNLELTVKKATRAMKTLEAQLTVDRKGDRQSISTRVAELDNIVPNYLGASTAVIENVIFCHQEESLWPLSDSASLKKKFDEIFEAQKYTRAIKTIADIRKKKKIELDQEKIREEHEKQNKDRAARAKKQCLDLQENIKKVTANIHALAERMEKASALASKAHEESEGFAKILGELAGKRIEAQSRKQNVEELRNTFTEIPESDEWLESQLEQFDDKQRRIESEVKSKQDQWASYGTQVKDIRNRLNKNLADRGKYQQEKDEHGRQIERRKNTVRDTAAKHGMRGYDDLSDDRLVDSFMHKIRKSQKDQQSALDRVRRENDAEKESVRTQINKLTARKGALQDAKIAANKQSAYNMRDAKVHQEKADAIQANEASKAMIESRIEVAKSKIAQAQQAARTASWDDKLKKSHLELRDLEETSTRLNNELIQGTRRAGETAHLAHVKQELKEKQRSLQTLTSAHQDRINSILGCDMEAGTVERVFQDAYDTATRDLNTATRESTATQQALEQVKFKLKTARTDLEKQNASVKSCVQKILDVIEVDPSEYEDALRDAEIRADEARTSGGGSKELQAYFEKALGNLHDTKPCCRTCKRSFKEQGDKFWLKAKENIEQRIAEAINQGKVSRIEEYESSLKDIQNLRTTYDTWKHATEVSIPELKKTLQSLEQESQSVEVKLEQREDAARQRDEAKKDLDSVAKTIANISQIHLVVEDLKKQSQELSAKQSQYSARRTLDEIQEEIASTAEKARKVQGEITRFTSEQTQSRDDLSELKTSLLNLQSDLEKVGYELDKKASALARVDEFKANSQKQRDIVVQADIDIEQLDPQIATAKAKLDDVSDRADTKERELAAESSEITTSVQALELLNAQIQAYLNRGGDNQLANVDRDIQNCENEEKRLTIEQNKLTKEVNSLMAEKKDGENVKRQYSDNLRYRYNSRALEKLAAEIQELESHNAEMDRERLRAESEKHTKEFNVMSAKQSGLMGEVRSDDQKLGELMEQFEVDFKDAPKRYNDCRIKVETTKAAVEDLAKYGTALDKAIMKYHSLKMDEINNILDELWKATYCGNDIDTIMIRADGDASTGKKSHNYRVMMIKKDTEMDMRGRCSAGQKVLASIIIRLALAECFSSNCGIFALDEPTTNLDQPNIEALAKALHGIIKARQDQPNFQLIVITHDDNFLRNMQCGDFADYYYRVSRNGNEKSIIERQDIASVL